MKSGTQCRLEIGCDATVSLLREHRGVLDACVASCRHITYYWLLASAICIVAAVRPFLVAAVALLVVLLRVVGGHPRILARIVGMIGGRVG